MRQKEFKNCFLEIHTYGITKFEKEWGNVSEKAKVSQDKSPSVLSNFNC